MHETWNSSEVSAKLSYTYISVIQLPLEFLGNLRLVTY